MIELNSNPLLREIHSCTLCEGHLPLQPKPIVNFSERSKILITGQAPGIKAHESGIAWNDASGERLCNWLGISREQLYNDKIFALVPMGFCYPGKLKTGDLPPRRECAEQWMGPVCSLLSEVELHIVIGQYAMSYFLGERVRGVTQTVSNWRKWYPEMLVLPHPSPRNNIWLKKNPWFESDMLPVVRERVNQITKRNQIDR